MASRTAICVATVGSSSGPSVVAAAVAGYAAGFAVMFVWARLLYRRHGVARSSRRALSPALLGGALGRLCVLVLAAAEHL